MRIGLLGATGFTGRLTAAELHRRGIDARLGGRSAARLAGVAEFGDTAVVDTTDPAALRGFLDGLDAVISCVGPFATLGAPVVRAAVAAGVPYVDSTGEPDFIAQVYAEHEGAATAVVPACGFDYVPSDCALAVAARNLAEPVTEVLVGYALRGAAVSRGTARSALGAVVAPATRITGGDPVDIPFAAGDRPGSCLPWGDQVLAPRQFPGARVRVAFAWPQLPGAAGPLGAAAAAAAPVLARAAATALPALGRAAHPLLSRLVDRLPEGPSPERRANSAWSVLAVVSGASGRRSRVAVDGHDMYGFTACALVEAALSARGAGPLTPAQAVGGQEFLDALRGPLLSWQALPD